MTDIECIFCRMHVRAFHLEDNEHPTDHQSDMLYRYHYLYFNVYIKQ